jgi:hypothetical protein
VSTKGPRALEPKGEIVPPSAGKEVETTGGMWCLEHWSIRVSWISFGSVNWPVLKEMQMVFLGIDWAEAHHDVCLLDEQGKVLGKRRVADGLEGVRRLHELVAEHA